MRRGFKKVQFRTGDNQAPPFTVYRVSEHACGSTLSVDYYSDKNRALTEAQKLADHYAVEHVTPLERKDVNAYGIMAVWYDIWPDPAHEIRIEEGFVR